MPTAVPALAPSPTPIVAPISEIEPVDGNVLPIAARDGAPGMVSCSGLGPFRFDALQGPWGAEGLVGPEYDVLRQTIAQYGEPDDPEFEGLGRATFKVIARDDTMVEFLGNVGKPEGPFVSATAAFMGGAWRWGGMDGGCRLTGAPGNGWDDALWDLDGAFKRPTAETRKIHLLVRETECAATVPVAGRVSPAWVFLEDDLVRIHVFVRSVRPRGSCDGVDPTPVTVVLPEPLGPRRLEDVVSHELCIGCGG